MLFSPFTTAVAISFLLGTPIFVKLIIGSTGVSCEQGRLSGYATNQLGRHAEKSRLTTRLQVFRIVLRGRAIYLRLLLSWSPPAALLFIIFRNDPFDERTADTLLLIVVGVLSVGWFVCVVFDFERTRGLTRSLICWEDSLLLPCGLTYIAFVFMVCRYEAIIWQATLAYMGTLYALGWWARG